MNFVNILISFELWLDLIKRSLEFSIYIKLEYKTSYLKNLSYFYSHRHIFVQIPLNFHSPILKQINLKFSFLFH